MRVTGIAQKSNFLKNLTDFQSIVIFYFSLNKNKKEYNLNELMQRTQCCGIFYHISVIFTIVRFVF